MMTSLASDPLSTLTTKWHGSLVGLVGTTLGTLQLARPAPLVSNAGELRAVQDARVVGDGICVDLGAQSSGFSEEITALEASFSTSISDLSGVLSRSLNGKWLAYLAKQPGGASRYAQIVTTFRSWSVHNAPDATTKGVATLSQRILLEGVAQTARGDMQPNSVPPYSPDLSTLMAQIASATPAVIQWTARLPPNPQRAQPAIRGGGSAEDNDVLLARAAAGKTIAVRAVVLGLATSPVLPSSDWYSPRLVQLLQSQRTSPPWEAGTTSSWDRFFGHAGTLARGPATLIIGVGMSVQASVQGTVDAGLTRQLETGAASGLWPLSVPDSAAGVTNTVIGQSQYLSLRTQTPRDIPIVLGVAAQDSYP